MQRHCSRASKTTCNGFRSRRRLASAVAVALTLVACDSNNTFTPRDTVAAPDGGGVVGATAETTTPDPAQPPVETAAPRPVAPMPPGEQVAAAGVRLELIPGTEQLRLITSMAVRPDGVTYYGLQDGYVWRQATDGTLTEEIDLTDIVSPHEPGSERGLLGLVVSPVDGRLFVYFTDDEIDSHVYSYALGADGAVDAASRWAVAYVEQPGLGHKGGGMVFLPDGSLLIALGDGGASRGRDAQDYSKVLGGQIRIVPRSDGDGYDIPADNPYYGNTNGWPQEIWSKGLRNPWGISIDAPTGDLWFADVGDNSMEEVNRVPVMQGGLNFGWYFIEGTEVKHEGAPADVVAPVFAYDYGDLGAAVIGGSVYRGAQIPALDGAYVFADMSGPVYALDAEMNPHRITAHTSVITGMGVDATGELVVLTLRDGAFTITPT